MGEEIRCDGQPGSGKAKQFERDMERDRASHVASQLMGCICAQMSPELGCDITLVGDTIVTAMADGGRIRLEKFDFSLFLDYADRLAKFGIGTYPMTIDPDDPDVGGKMIEIWYEEFAGLAEKE